MIPHLFCDFDGTVAIGDVTDVLLEAFADPSWHEIEAQWLAGQIGSATCMARQVALMRCGRGALDAALDAIEIDPAFPAFVEHCRREELPLTIVSDGLDYAIARILAKAGITGLPIIANRLLFLSEGHHAMLSPHASPDCLAAAGTCKCTTLAGGGGPAVLIGDGRSDFCAAATADLVLAKDALAGFCREQAIPHLAFRDFSEVPELLAGGLAALAAPALALAAAS